MQHTRIIEAAENIGLPTHFGGTSPCGHALHKEGVAAAKAAHRQDAHEQLAVVPVEQPVARGSVGGHPGLEQIVEGVLVPVGAVLPKQLVPVLHEGERRLPVISDSPAHAAARRDEGVDGNDDNPFTTGRVTEPDDATEP